MKSEWVAHVGCYGRVEIDRMFHECRVISVTPATHPGCEDVLRIQIGSVMYDFPRRMVLQRVYDDEKSLQAEIDRLTIENRDLKLENQCDVCVGVGKLLNGNVCSCGGSGKMSDLARELRRNLTNYMMSNESMNIIVSHAEALVNELKKRKT